MELILALIIANMVMRAAGDNAPLSSGQLSGLGIGRSSYRSGTWQQRSGSAREPRRAVRGGWRGLGDRLSNGRAGLVDRLRRSAERRWDQIEADRDGRAGRGSGPDERPWLRRWRDIRAVCPECLHGGQVAHRADCECTSCTCQWVQPPRRPAGQPDPEPRSSTPAPDPEPDPEPAPTVPAVPPPPPVGGDGSATSTDPTDPTPTTPGTPTEGDTDMTAPTAPTAPSSAPVVPGGGSAPAVGGGVASLGNLPPLDPSDIRFPDARAHLGAYARNMITMAEGLKSREVDTSSTGKFADLAQQMTGLVSTLNQIYGPVEQAVNDSQHVAQRDTYQHR